MAAYLVVEIEVTDPVLYEEYKRAVPEILSQFGGRYLARGGATLTLEGEWNPKRLVVVEFPSADRARQWWESMEYRPARDLRHRSARTRMVLVEGISS